MGISCTGGYFVSISGAERRIYDTKEVFPCHQRIPGSPPLKRHKDKADARTYILIGKPGNTFQACVNPLKIIYIFVTSKLEGQIVIEPMSALVVQMFSRLRAAVAFFDRFGSFFGRCCLCWPFWGISDNLTSKCSTAFPPFHQSKTLNTFFLPFLLFHIIAAGWFERSKFSADPAWSVKFRDANLKRGGWILPPLIRI